MALFVCLPSWHKLEIPFCGMFSRDCGQTPKVPSRRAHSLQMLRGCAQARSGAKPTPKVPIQQQILHGILQVSQVPYSSFLPEPRSPLHSVHAAIKQAWLVAIFLLIARAAPQVRLGMAALVTLTTVICLPVRLWKAQLSRLGLLCLVMFTFTAIGGDGAASVLQPRAPPPIVDGVPLLQPLGYHYVLLNMGIFTVTRRSLNLAITAASLTFCALQSASLVLVTTTAEEMAAAIRVWIQPLRLLGVNTKEVSLALLLSLRFMSLVFEEVRNLALGLAARGVVWSSIGGGGSVSLLAKCCARLFANLFYRAENISEAMLVRGFQGPERHVLYLTHTNSISALHNFVAVVLLVVMVVTFPNLFILL